MIDTSRRFAPKKDLKCGLMMGIPLLLCLLVISLVPVAILAGLIEISPVLLTVTAVVLVVAIFVLWTWFGTSYVIDAESVLYRSGPFRGKIPIGHITGIQRHASSIAGKRAVLSSDGLRICCFEPPAERRSYGRRYEVTIAPKEEEVFLDMLRARNDRIAIN